MNEFEVLFRAYFNTIIKRYCSKYPYIILDESIRYGFMGFCIMLGFDMSGFSFEIVRKEFWNNMDKPNSFMKGWFPDFWFEEGIKQCKNKDWLESVDMEFTMLTNGNLIDLSDDVIRSSEGEALQYKIKSEDWKDYKNNNFPELLGFGVLNKEQVEFLTAFLSSDRLARNKYIKEHDLEITFCKEANILYGWDNEKGNAHQQKGIPDRIFTKQYKPKVYIEFKRPDEKGRLSGEQKETIEKLRSEGNIVLVVNNWSDYDNAMNILKVL